MSKTINKLAYIIQGGIDPKEILTHAIAHVIASYQKRENIISKFSKIQALYNSEYHTSIPESVIRDNINTNFIVQNNLYELKSDFSLSINEIEEKFVKSEKDFTEKLNSVINLFYEFYKERNKNQEIRKQDCEKLFTKLFIATNKNNNQSDENEEYSSFFSTNYIIKQLFLKYLLNLNNGYYEIIEDIEITNSICSTKNFNFKKYDYSKTKFYLDTPILLKLLGYDGIDYRKFLQKCFNTMKCELFTFRHTVEETWGILYAWNNAYNQNNFTAKGLDLYLKARKELGSKKAEEAIPLDKSKLEDNILAYGITIEDKPELTEKNNVYSEEDLKKSFEDNYKSTYNSFPDRIQKDIDSIYGIQALRINSGIEKPESFEEARYFYLTDNKEFARISENKYIDSNNSNLCEIQYLDRIVYNIWIDSGKEILPKELFKLRCLTSNGISDEFRNDFTKIVNRIEKLEQDYNLTETLMSNPEYIQEAHTVYISNNKSIKHLNDYLSQLCKPISSDDQDSNTTAEKNEDSKEVEELKRKLAELQKENAQLTIQLKESLFKKIFRRIRNIFKRK